MLLPDSELLTKLIKLMIRYYERELGGPLPKPDPQPDPEPRPDPKPEPKPEPKPDPKPDINPVKTDVIRINNTGKKMSWNGQPYTKFVFPKKGPEYTNMPFDIVYADGNKLHIRDPERMAMTPDNMKYQPGGEYSRNNPDIPTMEVYARRGTNPDWVEARFRHPVDAGQPDNRPDPKPQPEPKPDDGWVTIQWRGDQSLGYGGHDSRDRTWWTKIHGSHSTPWSRKFPLPKSVENARSIDFKFSDGSTLHVPNPKGMAMGSNGPKYRPEDKGEGDSRKQHPKVGAIPKSPVTWVKYRTR